MFDVGKKLVTKSDAWVSMMITPFLLLPSLATPRSVIPALLSAGNGRSGNGWSGNGCLAKDEGTFRLWEGHSTIILRTVGIIMIVAVVAVVVEMKEEMNHGACHEFCCKS